MTNRVKILTVVLDSAYRDDDALDIVKAVSMIKGVCDVQLNVSDYLHEHLAKTELRYELRDKLLALFDRELPPGALAP